MEKFIAMIIAVITSAFSGKPSGEPRVENVDHIKEFEALRLVAYKPTAYDVWTIGYGHTSTASKGMRITEREAEALLRADLVWVQDAIKKLVDVPLSQDQYDALASFIFNVGRGAFSASTMRRKINASDMLGASKEFLRWNKQKQNGKMVVLRGLTRRRKVEQSMWLKGTKNV